MKAHVITDADRGFDRRPTAEEEDAPPDQRPWTEYDEKGGYQARPDFKAKTCYCPFFVCGAPCCVVELEWCCVEDGDKCCDICCYCRCGRLPICCCCGPQCNETCPTCCDLCEKPCCSCARMSAHGAGCCCCCDSCYQSCAPRYSGCKVCCLHYTCICCPAGCEQCCCCDEERLMMDGDLCRIPRTPDETSSD